MKKSLIVCSLLATTVLAHGDATGIVLERMDAMSAIGDSNKILSNISRGRADFDLAQVIEMSNQIAAHSGESLLELFPEDSLDSESDAKPEIWQDWETFSGLAMDLKTAASGLALITAESDFSTAYKNVSKTCGGCHRKFRVKR